MRQFFQSALILGLGLTLFLSDTAFSRGRRFGNGGFIRKGFNPCGWQSCGPRRRFFRRPIFPIFGRRMQGGGCGGGGCGGGRGLNGGRPAIPGGIHGGGCGGGGCGGGGNGRPGPRPIAEDPTTPPGLDPNRSGIREPSLPAEPPSMAEPPGPIEEPGGDLVPAPAVIDNDGDGPVWPDVPSPFDEVSPAPPNGAEAASLFTQSCRGCHQAEKLGIVPFDSWGKEEWGRAINQIEQKKMPPEEDALTPEQRGSIVEYLRQKINE